MKSQKAEVVALRLRNKILQIQNSQLTKQLEEKTASEEQAKAALEQGQKSLGDAVEKSRQKYETLRDRYKALFEQDQEDFEEELREEVVANSALLDKVMELKRRLGDEVEANKLLTKLIEQVEANAALQKEEITLNFQLQVRDMEGKQQQQRRAQKMAMLRFVFALIAVNVLSCLTTFLLG